MFGNFRGYWRGVGLAFRLTRFDMRRLYLNLMYFIEAPMVGQWMRRQQLRYLHVHLASQAAKRRALCADCFWIWLTVHRPDELYDTDRQMLAEKIRAVDFLCCISSFTRSRLMTLSPYEHWSKFLVSPLGVNPEIFAPKPARAAQECSETQPAPEAFEILCVGQLTPARDQNILIDAVERLTQIDRLTQEGRRVRLRLVGNGLDETSLREHAVRSAAHECIVFGGAINQDRIRGFYAAADVFCLPSFAEGVPVVLMEAMAMELPRVTTHIAGIPELIRNGVDRLLVPRSNLDAQVTALAL